MKENTLGVKEMKIVSTEKFLRQFLGKAVTFWVGAEPIFFSLSSVVAIKLVDLGEKPIRSVVFFGISETMFAIDVNLGFGLNIQGHNNKIWVDRMNEKDTAIIVYSSDEDKPIQMPSLSLKIEE
jgi:hypothetical protein